MRILVAEDDAVSRRILEAMLHRWGHEVVVAFDDNEAWAAMQREDAPHLAILDWMMPGMDGIDVCRRIREAEKYRLAVEEPAVSEVVTDKNGGRIRPYIILLTGKGRKQDVVMGISAGADDYVTKPFDPDELKMRVHAGERIVNLQLESRAAKNALEYQATHDGLTGLLNRASIMGVLQQEFSRERRTGAPVSILLGDLDHFKQINDTHGHQVGDAVLAEVAARMQAKMRPYENLARYGGEEFMAVLTGSDLRGSRTAAERLHGAVVSSPFCVNGVTLNVGISFGVSCSLYLENATPDILIRRADEALYRAKGAGRNRIEVAESPETGIFYRLLEGQKR